MFIFLKSKKQVIAFRASIKIQRLFWKYVAPCLWPLFLPGGLPGVRTPPPGWPFVPRCHLYQGSYCRAGVWGGLGGSTPGSSWGKEGVFGVSWHPVSPTLPPLLFPPPPPMPCGGKAGPTMPSWGGGGEGSPLTPARPCVPPKFSVCVIPPPPQSSTHQYK